MTPELETHHGHHHTGHRWVDFSVAACALLVSLCSLGIAIHHGHTMERLVQANSLPFLQIIYSNAEPRATGEFAEVMSFQVRNAGTGPARIEWFKSEFDGQPFKTWRDFIAKVDAGAEPGRITISDVAPYFIKGGDSLAAMRWERTEQNATLWNRIDNVTQDRVHLQACYCSIFDECWIADSKVFKPKSVDRCEGPAKL